MQLTTDWIKVATSGPTIDGREIPEQDVQDMADSYDPEEYTAVIWSSDPLGHSKWYGNFGTAAELKAEKDKKGRLCLFAKLRPNKRLLELNSQGQKLFTSIELWPNFAGTGKAYMTGLAITDEPASLGTQQLHFSKQHPGHVRFSQSIPFALDASHEATDSTSTDGTAKDGTPTDETPRTLFSKLAATFGWRVTDEPETPNEDDEAMDAKQFNQLLQAQQQTNTLLGQLGEALGQFSQQNGQAAGTESGTEQTAAKPAEDGTTDQFSQLADQVAETNNGIQTLTEQFSKLLEEKPGTPTGANDGAAGDEKTKVY